MVTGKLAVSASKELPVRSTLKQTSYPILPLLSPENERQVTTEPGDPLTRTYVSQAIYLTVLFLAVVIRELNVAW